MISTKRTAGIKGDNHMNTNRPAATKEDPKVKAEVEKMTKSSKTFRHEPGRYEIRLKGHHDDRWADRFGGLTIRREDNDET